MFHPGFQKILIAGQQYIGSRFNGRPQNGAVIDISDLRFGPIFLSRHGNQFQSKQCNGKEFVQRCQFALNFLLKIRLISSTFCSQIKPRFG